MLKTRKEAEFNYVQDKQCTRAILNVSSEKREDERSEILEVKICFKY